MTEAPLDSHQQAAVAHGEGPALVLAGPGSGKTRVIVERVARLIDEELARPEELLVVTFSRKAASDLRERLAARLRRSYASFPVTTFHAFCLSVLDRSASAPPRLVRPAERRALARLALAEEDNLGYPPTNALVDEALAFSELCDDYLTEPEHALARVRARYLSALDEHGALDFGGLQREAIRLLEEDDDLRRDYEERIRFILVDEYQDTNVAQDRLLVLLAGARRNVFCVADEDQSIYGFRGAEIQNTIEFDGALAGRTALRPPDQLPLRPRIVDLAKDVIRLNVDTHIDKEHKPAEERPATLAGRTFAHAAQEADWIAREIARLRLEGLELGQVAVLARSLREMGPRLAYTFRRHNLPFFAPLEPPVHPTVDALLVVLEVAHAYPWEDPHEERVLRALASPLFGADSLGLRNLRRQPRTLYGALRDSGDYDPFFQALAIVKRQASPGAAIYALWERLDYFRSLQQRCRPFDAPREDIEELAAVTSLSNAANEWEGDLDAFPEAFRAGQLTADESSLASALPRDAVPILTVHQAKGLEWEAVFVCDLVEGRFPALARAQYTLFDRELFSRRQLSEAERARRALEEERRLFYVALTRARSRLVLTATEEAREEAGRSLSRFYLEALDHLDPAEDAPDGPVSADEALAAVRRAGGGPPGWRSRAESANERPMLPTGGLWTSASRLAPYENCPLQFFYGNLLELGRTEGPALSFGRVFHDVVQAFHDPELHEPQTLERLLELAKEKWTDEGWRLAPVAVEQRRILEALLQQYYELEVEPGLDAEVLAVEQRFEFELDASTLTGYIDRIDRCSDGRLRLVDYKTSKKAMREADAAEDLQLALYGLAFEHVPELSRLGEVGELVYLYPRHVAYGRLARRGQDMTPELAEATRARIRGLIERITSEEFDFSQEANCRWCGFKTICLRHQGGDAPV